MPWQKFPPSERNHGCVDRTRRQAPGLWLLGLHRTHRGACPGPAAGIRWADAGLRSLAPGPGQRLARLDRDQTNAFRWVHGEGDGLPGIHVDLYDQVAVVRFDGAGARPSTAISMTCWPSARPRCACHASSIASGATAIWAKSRYAKMEFASSWTWAGARRRAVSRPAREPAGGGGSRCGPVAAESVRLHWRLFTYAAAAGATRTDTVDIAKPALATARRNFQLNVCHCKTPGSTPPMAGVSRTSGSPHAALGYRGLGSAQFRPVPARLARSSTRLLSAASAGDCRGRARRPAVRGFLFQPFFRATNS